MVIGGVVLGSVLSAVIIAVVHKKRHRRDLNSYHRLIDPPFAGNYGSSEPGTSDLVDTVTSEDDC